MCMFPLASQGNCKLSKSPTNIGTMDKWVLVHQGEQQEKSHPQQVTLASQGPEVLRNLSKRYSGEEKNSGGLEI